MNAAEFLKSDIKASDFLRGSAADFLKAENPVYRQKITANREVSDPVISAEMGQAEGRPMWVSALDFLTGHFPEMKDVPEVQTVDGKLQVNVPPTAEVPFLQSPEMALGAGVAKGLAAPIGKKLLVGAREALAWGTGGVSEVPAMVKGAVKPSVTLEQLEPLVKGGKVGKLPKYAEGSSINLERMDTTQDVKQFINSLTPEAGIERKVVSWEETERLGEELGWDAKEFLKQAKAKGGFSPEEIAAMRQINANISHDIYNAIRELPSDHALRTPEMRLMVADKMLNAMQVLKATSEKATAAGRGLNYFKKMIADNPEYAKQKRLEMLMEKMGVTKLTDDMIDDIAKTDFGDPLAVREMLQKYHKSSIWEKLHFAWLNGLLSAFPTHSANIVGNVGAVAMKVPEHATANILRGKSPWGEATAESIGMLNGILEGTRAAIKGFKTGIPSHGSTYVDIKRLNPIPGVSGAIIGAPTRALTAMDEFFKAILYRSELHRQAFIKTKGVQGEARKVAMDTMMNNPESKGFKAIHDLAEQEALYRTYQKKLGQMGSAVMRLRDTVPGFKYLVPFIRTPINIAKFSLERTPFALAKMAKDYKLGNLTKEETADQLSKMAVGAMISTPVVIAALDGKITGGPPDDKKERELKEAAGIQWYSMKVGNRWYSYNRFEPVGSVMGLTADFVETAKSDADILERSGLVMKAFARNISSKTFVTSLSAALDAMFGTDPNKMARWGQQMAGSVVPAAVGRVAGAMDPYVREATNPLEAIQARVPIWSRSLPYKPEITLMTQGGVPITKPRMKEGGPLMQIFSPVQVSDVPPDAATYEGLLKMHEVEKKINKAKKEALKETLRDIRRTNR